MGEKYAINIFRRNGEWFPVASLKFPLLVHATVYQESEVVSLDEVARAGDALGGAQESQLDLHLFR